MCAVSSDLTNTAQIRNAAMKLFAERGYEGTSIRAVALEAGVSPSLVIHHFGAKSALKNAVDSWVEATVKEMLAELSDDSAEQSDGHRAMWDRLIETPDLTAYLRRMLIDGGEAAQSLFAGLLEATVEGMAVLEQRGGVVASSNPRMRALFLMVNDLGLVLLRDLVASSMGSDPFSKSGSEAWDRIMTETYTNGVFAKPVFESEV